MSPITDEQILASYGICVAMQDTVTGRRPYVSGNWEHGERRMLQPGEPGYDDLLAALERHIQTVAEQDGNR